MTTRLDHPKLLSLFVAASSLAVAGCGPTSPEVRGGDETARHQEMSLYVASKYVWPSPEIPVCWVDPKPEHEVHRAWTREAAASSWEAVSAVRFVGWGTCTGSEGASLKIAVSDENPYAYVGTSGAHLSFNVLLNFTFQYWSADFCQANLEFCVKTIAVHELGHALGFDHEQNRPDTPSWCQKDAFASGDTVIGPWDLDSVMNYCNPEWSGNGTLSEIDIAGVQAVYGTSPGGGGGDPAPSCTYACKDYGFAPNQCYEGWYCSGECLEYNGCAPACTYACKDYGYAPGQCYEGWYCDGSCLQQTGCQ